MIVDTSVLVAIIKDESNSAELARVILAQDRPRMSAASYVELMCVLARLGGPAADRRGDQLLAALGVEIVEVSVEQARLAAEAYRVFGKGSGHRAGLNFATRSPTPWRSPAGSHCCSSATISGTLTSPASTRGADRGRPQSGS